MANAKVLEAKAKFVEEIKTTTNNASTIVLFDYRGLTDHEPKEIRRALRETDSDYKVFKNTLMKRAFNELDIHVDESLEGPSALAYGSDAIAPIKVLSDFAKNHPALVMKVGVVDGEVSDSNALAELAKIPSRDGLLTMLAGAMIAIPKDLSICLDLYAQQKEEN